MAKICFAILAHNNRECLQDLLVNLKTFEPDSFAVLFNGGLGTDFFQGLDVSLCPASVPIAWGKNLERVVMGLAEWLYQTDADYEFLVVLDADQLLIKPGLGEFLDETMKDSLYMAMQFHRIRRGTPWTTGRRFLFKWERIWQPIFETADPYGCYNPGQIFRREYIERLIKFSKLPKLRLAMQQSSTPILEELIWPTLAVTLKCFPLKNPASSPEETPYEAEINLHNGLQPPDHLLHKPSEIRAYLSNPNIFLIHKVGMSLESADREYVRHLASGQEPDMEMLDRRFLEQHPIKPAPHPLITSTKTLVRDLQYRLTPN